MIEADKELSLADLIDIDFLQQFQDTFAETTNLAGFTYYGEGTTTKPSNFSDFCLKYTRGTEKGLKRCTDCDQKWGKIVAQNGKPEIYTCHAGLTDFAVPIIVDGKQAGTILGGQIFTEPPNEEHYRQLAREIGVNEDDYIKALKKIKIVSPETIEAATNLLYIVAKAISDIGHKNLELMKKNANETLYRNITETIRRSLDIDETKQQIVDIIGKTLKADRCFIIDYNEKNDNFYIVNTEYLSSDKILGSKGKDANADSPNFAAILKKGKRVLVNNQQIFLDPEDEHINFDTEKKAIKEYNINSILATPLYYYGSFLGVLNIHYNNKNREIGKDEIELFNAIANEVSTALYHSKMFSLAKKQAEREATLRKIIETVRSAIDIRIIKKTIVSEIGELLKAYRCFTLTLNLDTGGFYKLDENSVYLSEPDIKGLVGFEPSIEIFNKTFKNCQEIITLDPEAFIKENNLSNTDAEKYFKDYNVKAAVAIPVVHLDKLYGVLAIQYNEKMRDFDDDNIEFIKTIAKQVGVALHQNWLFEKEKKAAEKEALLRTITETIKSSTIIEATKQQIVNIIGKNLNADRCLIIEYDKKKDKFSNLDNEYLSSSNIISLKGINPNISIPNFLKLIKGQYPVIIKDKTMYTNGQAQIFDIESGLIEKYGITSALIYQLFYLDNLLGFISVHYENQTHTVTNEELELLSVVANQTAMALHQAKLYDALKQTTANQNAILNNMPYMAWLKDDKNKFLAVNESFAKKCNSTVENLIGKTDFDFFPKAHAESYFREDSLVIETKQTLSSVDLIKGIDGERWHETFKSPLFDDKGKAIGTVGLASDITERKEIEVELLRRNEQITKAAEREKLLRELVSEISSTLDSNKIRKLLVSKLGCALNSDLDIIYVRDQNTGRFLPMDEYSTHLASEEIKNPVGINIIEDYGWEEFILKNKKSKIAYSSIEDLKRDYKLYGTKPADFLDEYKIKSMIAIPIMYANDFLGLLVMNFVKEPRIITEDDVNLVQIVANQAAIALYQSKLYIQVQEASRAKSEFIANMSHEIKTPLNIIIGFSDLLAQSQLSPSKQIKYLENINNSGKHLLNLTNDIFNIAKIESGNFEIDYEDIDSELLIIDVVDSLKLIANGKNISITIETTRANINADRKMLIQILYNLLNNAIKFTPDDGKIKVTSILDNDKLVVSIKDTGIGIATENQNVIFEKFKQIDSSVQRTQQGAGLGLAITKKLVELHNGELFVESKKDEGSRFWFVLPNASYQ